MLVVKSCISLPLEAGRSILDCKHLPEELTSALNYVSSRLVRKRLHLSLIVIRKDDTSINPLPQSMAAPSRTTSPARSLFDSSSTPTLSRSVSRKSTASSRSEIPSISSCASLSRTKWPSLPASPRDASARPAIHFPLANIRASLNPYGITLMHSSTLTPKAEKILRQTIAKAEKKFAIGTGYLSPQSLTSDITCASTNELIRRSLKQNSVLYSSEGLTLLALDHIYTFKAYLDAYSKSLAANDLTIAVDELHRLVLAQKGRKVSKGYLLRAYEWLPTSLSALFDINEGYKTAYGGNERVGGIDVSNEDRNSPPPLQTSFGSKRQTHRIKLVIPVEEIKRQSTILLSPVEVGESAKGTDDSVEDLIEDRGPHRRGAITPNSDRDLTPGTRGEWMTLMIGEGWNEARTAAVETF